MVSDYEDYDEQCSTLEDNETPRPDPPPLEIDNKVGGSPIVSDYEDYEEVCSTLEDIYEDVVPGYFNTANPGSTLTWERLSQQDAQHVIELYCVNNPNIVPIWKYDFFDSFYWIASRPNCPIGNLKEYVLQRQCNKENIDMFLSQVASAFHYLHSKHIVHGDLRPEYVNVVSPYQVQVGRLGGSKGLSMKAYEVTSTSCVVQVSMPPDASRWSAPEVIRDGYYSHSSDVWAFGILAWELYASYQHGQEQQQFSKPYYWLGNDKILPYQRDNGPLNKPYCCPDWVYILMHQCWAFDSKQRPPFLAIFDCLTSREPMKSWIMKLWLRTHNKEKWPDLSVSQGDAPHVLGEDSHPTEGNIKTMCSEDYFAQHLCEYMYEEESDAYGPNERFEEAVNPSDSYNPSYEKSSQVCETKVSVYSGEIRPQRNDVDVHSKIAYFEKLIKENQNTRYANERSAKGKPQYTGAHHTFGYEFNNHERATARHTAMAHTANKESDANENCEIHAADKDEAFCPKRSTNKECQLNEIHYERLAGPPKEREYQSLWKHGSDQEFPIGTEKTQSSQPKKDTKMPPAIEEDIYDCVIATSGDSQMESMNANGYLDDKQENVSLKEACNIEPNSFQEEISGMTSWQGAAGAPTESGNCDIETTQTNKMDMDRPPVHYQQPSYIPKDTECQRNGEPARDRTSPLRRKNAMRRKKRQNFQYKREAKCKPDDKENVCENKTSPHESQREHLSESETVLMEDERKESPLQKQATTRERHNSVLKRQFTSIVVVDISL